jgi:hypothetical protein
MAFPKIDTCILCEGVREEINRKYILLGFYGICQHVRVLVKDFQIPLTFCFVFCGGEGEGKFNLDFRVRDAAGATINNTLPSAVVGAEVFKNVPNTTVFFTFQGTFAKSGDYNISLIVDNVEHYSATLYLRLIDDAGIKARLN